MNNYNKFDKKAYTNKKTENFNGYPNYLNKTKLIALYEKHKIETKKLLDDLSYYVESVKNIKNTNSKKEDFIFIITDFTGMLYFISKVQHNLEIVIHRYFSISSPAILAGISGFIGSHLGVTTHNFNYEIKFEDYSKKSYQQLEKEIVNAFESSKIIKEIIAQYIP